MLPPRRDFAERLLPELHGRIALVSSYPLAEVGAQIARLVRLAESAEDVDEIGERLAALRLERDGLVRQLEAPFEVIDAKRLREMIEAELARVYDWLGAPDSGGREVLRALLGGQRMRFGPDATLAVRVEGAFELRLDFRGAGRGARGASTKW